MAAGQSIPLWMDLALIVLKVAFSHMHWVNPSLSKAAKIGGQWKDLHYIDLPSCSCSSNDNLRGWDFAWHRLVFFALQMFSVIPHKFLPAVRNPCWYEEFTGNTTSDPYRTNLYACYSRRFRIVFQHLRNTFQEHLFHRDGKLYRMRCLPYFYIIGQPKCGTTDLYDRLRLHPDVKFTTFKEPHWWTRKRFGEYRRLRYHLQR